MSITFRNTETTDRYDIDVILRAIPGSPATRVTEAKVEIVLADSYDRQPDDPEGGLLVTVDMWGYAVKSDLSRDGRFTGSQRVTNTRDEQERYELERELVRASLKRHHLSEALVVTPDMQSWEAHQYMVREYMTTMSHRPRTS